jgi:CRISPR system Cascade subunit CasC
MNIELHILQNHAPSNMNRDDTGAPKDAVFGGVRRARISSQCWKRAIREDFLPSGAFAQGDLAVRTKRLAIAVGEFLANDHGDEPGRAAALRAIGEAGLKFDAKTDKTSCLLFVPERHVKAIASIVHEHWNEVTGKKEIPAAVTGRLMAVLADTSRTPDLALFGRMVAEVEGWGLEGACQVAHAISTHAVDTEFDYFTAVDDLQKSGETGGAHLGHAQFSSACFYRYLGVHAGALAQNLGDPKLLAPTLRAFLHSAVHALPGGKQATFAANQRPSYVLAVAHEGQALSLANAFAEPVRAGAGRDLIGGSILALEHHWRKLRGMYGARPKEVAFACANVDVTRPDAPGIAWVSTLAEVLDPVLARASEPS